MKIKRKPKSKLILPLIILLASILLTCGILYLLNPPKEDVDNNQIPTDNSQSTQVEDQKETDTKEKKAYIDSQKNQSNNSTTTNNDTTTELDRKIVINATQDSDEVVIITKLYGISDGACSLNITNGTKNVKKTAAVLYQPEFSTCLGLSTTTKELGPGLWKLSLSVSSNGKTYSEKDSLQVK